MLYSILIFLADIFFVLVSFQFIMEVISVKEGFLTLRKQNYISHLSDSSKSYSLMFFSEEGIRVSFRHPHPQKSALRIIKIFYEELLKMYILGI